MRKHYISVTFVSLCAIGILDAQPADWSTRGVGGGGALFSPSINPADHNEYYVACDMSQLFHTTDYGLSYNQVHFGQLQAGNSSKVCYTSTGTLYSINYAHDMAVPVKSTNNGNSWTALAGNPDNSEATYSLFVDYNNANRIIISYYGGIYFSSNGGTSFAKIHTAADLDVGVVVGGAFFDGSSIYLGTSNGLLVSTNGGANWAISNITGIPSGQAIWSFCGSKVGNVTRFFCIAANVGDIYPGVPGSDYYGFAKGIYSCDYGTTNWTSKSAPINFSTEFPFFIDMAENNISTVYAAGSNENGEPRIFKSLNAGSTWTSTIFNTANNANIATGWSGQGGDRGWGYGECAMGFDVASNDPNYVLISDFGFVHKTKDGGSTWQQAYVSTADQNPENSATPAKKSYHSIGLENTTSWQVTWADSLNLFACFSDIRGIRSADGGLTWSFNYTGNVANSTYRIAKGNNGTMYAATSSIHDMYQSTRLADNILDGVDAEGKILYSTNKGLTWQLLHLFSHPVFWIALDPNNANRAYASVIHYSNGAGVGGVYRCDNFTNLATSTWTLLPNPPRTQKHPASLVVLNDGKLVATYSGRRDGTGFTKSSGCFVYDPIGNGWTDVSDPGMMYWTKDIVIDPNDPNQNTWYVAVFSGWGGAPNGLGGLYKTINRGQAWKRISDLDRVTSCTFNPKNKDEIYLTTEQEGLWICSNVNATTPTFKQVGNYDFRQPERVFFNPYKPTEIWVTSFGNGLKVGQLGNVTGMLDSVSTHAATAVSFYPNPTNGKLILLGVQNRGESVAISDLSGHEIGRAHLETSGNDVVVDLSFLPYSGIYVLQIGSQRIKVVVEKE